VPGREQGGAEQDSENGVDWDQVRGKKAPSLNGRSFSAYGTRRREKAGLAPKSDCEKAFTTWDGEKETTRPCRTESAHTAAQGKVRGGKKDHYKAETGGKDTVRSGAYGRFFHRCGGVGIRKRHGEDPRRRKKITLRVEEEGTFFLEGKGPST